MPVKLLSSFFGWGVLGNCTALDVAFLETASCLGVPFPERKKKVNGIQFVHFGLHLSQSPEKHSAFHDPYEQPDLPWHTGEGGGFLFPLTQPGAAAPTPS